VIFQRYVADREGRMNKVMTVTQMCGSEHSKDLRLYDVTAGGPWWGHAARSPRHNYRRKWLRRHDATESGDSRNRPEQQ